jgi:hypothetical protein
LGLRVGEIAALKINDVATATGEVRRVASSGWSMSALPPEADMLIVGINVC